MIESQSRRPAASAPARGAEVSKAVVEPLAAFGARQAATPSDDAEAVEIVEVACAEALEQGVRSADVVLNILARSRDTGPPPTITTPEALRLNREPVADCARYNSLRGPAHRAEPEAARIAGAAAV